MIFCYIDESGTPEIPGNGSHYVLAGLAIPIHKWKRCEQEIQKIKAQYQLSEAEIHTGWLIRSYWEQSQIPDFESLPYAVRRYEVEKQRNEELAQLKGPSTKVQFSKTKKNYKATSAYTHLTFEERKQFVTQIAALIGSWSFCRLFAECIDKTHFNPVVTTLSVDVQAFEQVVSRFEQYLKIYSKTTGDKKYGLLVHDNNETVKRKHTDIMKQFHSRGTLWTSISNIIETPMFVDSQLTSMIQIADVCSYALRRYTEKGEDYLFREIFKIADKKDNRVVGVRHFTGKACSCKICVAHR